MSEVVGAKYLFPIHYLYTTPAFDAIKTKNDFPDAIVFSAELESCHTAASSAAGARFGFLATTPPIQAVASARAGAGAPASAARSSSKLVRAERRSSAISSRFASRRANGQRGELMDTMNPP
jgi:hypothetical protein